jgi:hypothetical protein
MLPLLKEKKKADPNPHRNKSRQKEERMDSLREISAKVSQQGPKSESSQTRQKMSFWVPVLLIPLTLQPDQGSQAKAD